MANTLQWPEIQQFPQYIAWILNNHLDACETAAKVLQAHYRQKVDALPSGLRLRRHYTRQEVDALLNQDQVVALHKLDGTNVGKEDNGSVFGRRQKVEGDSYQKTDVGQVKKIDVHAIKEALTRQLAWQADMLRVLVYGELVVNRLYDYQDEGLFKTWQCFGLLVKLHPDQAPAFLKAAQDAGFGGKLCGGDEESSGSDTVLLPLTDALRSLLVHHGAACVPEMCRGSLLTVTSQAHDWMAQQRGEGLVLTLGGRALKKWKGGHEPQPNNVDCLRELGERLDCFPESLGFLPASSPATRRMLQQLRVVAAPPSGTGKENKTNKPKAKPAQAYSQEAAERATALKVALESALTKYDALDTYFARGPDAVKQVVEALGQEVCDDMKVGPSDKAAEKECRGLVARHVGQLYGRFKSANRP